MQRKLLFAAVVLLVVGGSFLGKWWVNTGNETPGPGPRQANRIVSTAPSITETLFALGLGDRVVGRTPFCKVPPEDEGRIVEIGALLDPNLEVVVALRPDVVVVLAENEQSRFVLKELGIRSLVVSHKTVDDILESFAIMGREFGAQQKADALVADVKARIERVQRKVAGRKRPRVMFSVYRSVGSGRLEAVTIAGKDDFYDRMIAIAGGENVCLSETVLFPQVSSERILWMNPEVIIDVSRPISQTNVDRPTALKDWQQVADVEAVRNGRVHLIDDDFAFVPGPRFILLIEKLARLLHPELDWKEGD
ncbi:MAG: ABC transporter substrate-binding protein [Candidatus Nealsonbacteria bacterium]|nr:ABC transporter substrate-binding protein [Candidatus Nealsonbacteria bacterium]